MLRIIFVTTISFWSGKNKMKRILIVGAGGAPSEGCINSLLKSDNNFEVIGKTAIFVRMF